MMKLQGIHSLALGKCKVLSTKVYVVASCLSSCKSLDYFVKACSCLFMSSKTSFRSHSLSYDNTLKFTVVDITFIFSCWFLTVQFAHMSSLCWLFLKIARFRRSQIGKIKSKQWKNIAKISEPVLIMVCAWYKSCIKIIYTKICRLLISTSIQRVCCVSSFFLCVTHREEWEASEKIS